MWYFIIGFLIIMFVDYKTFNLGEELRLTTIERILFLLIWPVFVIIVIIEMIKMFNDE